MADKMEKIAPIPSVQFSSKSNGYKLRSVGFNISFYCHDDIFVAIRRDSVAIRRDCSAKNIIFCCRRDSKKLEINSYLRHVGDMTLPLGIPLNPNWRDLWWVFHIFKKILYGRNALRKRFYHTISPTLEHMRCSIHL